MMKTCLAFLLLIFMMEPSNTAFADGALDGFPKYRHWLLIGGELGYISKGGVTAPEVDGDGLEFGLKGIYSRYWDDWALDIGLGLRTDKLSGEGVSTTTKAFMLELAGRYRLTENWSLGPVITGLLGQDVSFSDVGTNSDDRSFTGFLGGRVMFEPTRKSKSLLRLGLQAQTDIGLGARRVTWVQGLIEFGWPFAIKKDPPPPKKKKIIKRKVVKKRKAKPKQKIKVVEKIVRVPLKLNLMNAGVRFATSKSELIGRSRDIIEGIARVLSKYNSQWASISILGHTDVRGDYEFNVKLSLARAETVAGVLKDYGIESNKMTVAGYGPERLLDAGSTSEAHAKNRRVEIQIAGASPSKKFVQELRAAANGQNL